MALFLGEESEGELDEYGKEVGQEKYEETEPEIVKYESKRQTKKPIAGADEFFFGEEIE